MTELRPQELNKSLRRRLVTVNIGSPSITMPVQYQFKLDNWLSSMKSAPIKPEEVAIFDIYDDGSAIEVSHEPEFEDMMKELTDGCIISVDFEHHTEDAFNGYISLIQVSTLRSVYVIDPLQELWNSINERFTKQVLENPKILKVFCGMSNDVLLAQTTFNTFMVATVDIQHMYNEWKKVQPEACFTIMKPWIRELEKTNSTKRRRKPDLSDEGVFRKWEELEKVSYQTIVHAFFGRAVRLDKAMQRSDWRVRPLGELVDYAAKDVYYLLRLFHILYKKIGANHFYNAIVLGKNELLKTASVRELGKFQKMSGIDKLNVEELECVKRLHQWRLNLANRLDRNPIKLMPDEMLIKFATSDATSVESVKEFVDTFYPSDTLLKQTRMMIAYKLNDQKEIDKKTSQICHNCNLIGHIAFECEAAPSASARAAFLNRPENQARKEYQRQRRIRKHEENVQRRNAALHPH